MTDAADREKPKGTLVAIGGGDFEEAEQIDRYMLDLAGGLDAPVAFVPTAHPSRKVAEKFLAYYAKLGARNVTSVPVYEREDAFRKEDVDTLLGARLIFIGWGRNTRLVDGLLGTPIQDALTQAYRQGAVMGCMSAGARMAGALSIARGTGMEALRQGIQDGPIREEEPGGKGPIQFQPSFGWVRGVVFEPHLGEYNRYGHFLLLASVRPDLTWVGIDERTAVVVHPDERVEVIGSYNVFVSHRTKPAKVVAPSPTRPLEAWGVQMDILAHGSETTLAALRGER
jgi:cyanophycinase